jgi:HB1/ASXL restriction endonuclease-like protein with HTH domain
VENEFILMPDLTISEFIEDLDRQMDELNRQAAHLSATIDGLAEQRARLLAQVNDLVVAKVIASSSNTRFLASTSDRLRETTRLTIADAAETVLREEGGQAEMAHLVTTLTERGILRGRERRATLSTQLLRHKGRFHSPRPGRWALGPGTGAELPVVVPSEEVR